MNRDGEKRIYIQMQPDGEACQEFVKIGEALPTQSSGRLLPPEELHVTLIHFGKASDVLAAIRSAVPLTDDVFAKNLEEYITATRAILTDQSYGLTNGTYDRFGARSTTLVAVYDAPPALHTIHAQAYRLLIRFIHACGVADAEAFAHNDPNFMHAASFKPHVTIYKGYAGPDPLILPPASITLRFMKLVY